jgi:hypothetical protein
MSDNPYQSPTVVESVVSAAQPAAASKPHIEGKRTPRVDGKYLIVSSEDGLPRFCVRTNGAVSVLDMRTKEFTWCSPLVSLLILVSGPLLILVYYVARKRCYLNFGLSEQMQRRYRNRFIAKIATVCVLFVALPMTAAVGDGVGMIVLLLFLAAVVSLFFGNSPLAITKHSNGEFWMAGCCPGILNRIESENAG